MNITLSQAGMKPITISTESGAGDFPTVTPEQMQNLKDGIKTVVTPENMQKAKSIIKQMMASGAPQEMINQQMQSMGLDPNDPNTMTEVMSDDGGAGVDPNAVDPNAAADPSGVAGVPSDPMAGSAVDPNATESEPGQGFDLSNSHVDENGNWTSNPNVNPASQDFVNQASANQQAAYDADIADRVNKERERLNNTTDQMHREMDDASNKYADAQGKEVGSYIARRNAYNNAEMARGHIPTSAQNGMDKLANDANSKHHDDLRSKVAAYGNLHSKIDAYNDAVEKEGISDDELADQIRNEDQERAKKVAAQQDAMANSPLAKLEAEKQKLSEMELDPNTSADEITAQRGKVRQAGEVNSANNALKDREILNEMIAKGAPQAMIDAQKKKLESYNVKDIKPSKAGMPTGSTAVYGNGVGDGFITNEVKPMTGGMSSSVANGTPGAAADPYGNMPTAEKEQLLADKQNAHDRAVAKANKELEATAKRNEQVYKNHFPEQYAEDKANAERDAVVNAQNNADRERATKQLKEQEILNTMISNNAPKEVIAQQQKVVDSYNKKEMTPSKAGMPANIADGAPKAAVDPYGNMPAAQKEQLLADKKYKEEENKIWEEAEQRKKEQMRQWQEENGMVPRGGVKVGKTEGQMISDDLTKKGAPGVPSDVMAGGMHGADNKVAGIMDPNTNPNPATQAANAALREREILNMMVSRGDPPEVIAAQKAKVENADSYASKAAAWKNNGGEGTKETMDDAINAAEQEKRRANAFGNGMPSTVQEIYHNNNDTGSKMGTDEHNKQVLASRADNGQNPLQKNNKFQGALDTVTGAATNAANTAMQNPGKVAAGAGILMAANLFLRHVLGGTVFNAATSIGKFRSGNEMLNSPKLNQNLAKVARKYQKPYPTAEEVKADPKAKSKETFMAWLLSGQTGNQRISNQIGSSGTLVKTSQLGIPVAITTLSPAKSQALQQLGGNKIVIATAFFRKNGQIVSEPVARGFLAKGSVVNASLEAADIFFNARGQKFNKAQIKYLADKSYESFGPNPDFEAKIIDWYCL